MILNYVITDNEPYVNNAYWCIKRRTHACLNGFRKVNSGGLGSTQTIEMTCKLTFSSNYNRQQFDTFNSWWQGGVSLGCGEVGGWCHED